MKNPVEKSAKKAKPDDLAKSIFAQLKEHGIQKSLLAKAVPSWWEKSMGTDFSAVAQLAFVLSRRLHLNFEALTAEKPRVVFDKLPLRKFKTARSTEAESLNVISAVATKVAEALVSATGVPYTPLPSRAIDMREQLLALGKPSLQTLLQYCWDSGIPVVHIGDCSPKPHGIAIEIEGRPAIVLCNNRKPNAWLLFHLAHELGHIAKGHLSGSSLIIDQKISLSDTSVEETEANEYAQTIISGDAHAVTFGIQKPQLLAAKARLLADLRKTDAGYLVLRSTYLRTDGKNTEGLAENALKLIGPSDNGPELVNRILFGRIDSGAIGSDTEEWLLKVCKVEGPIAA